MKRLMVAALLCAGVLPAVAGKLSVAYPVPGVSDLMPPEHRLRIVVGNFLDDLFRHDTDDFTRVGDRVKGAIIAQINSGAWQFPTDDKRVNFEQWHPLDLFIDFEYHGGVDPKTHAPTGKAKVDFWWKGGSASQEFTMNRLPDICEWILGQIVEKCGIPAANAEKLKKFLAERKAFLVPYYLAPGIVGHYCDNGVDTRMPCALDGFKLSRDNPLMATRCVDAAYLLVLDHRELKKYTSAKVKALGMTFLEKCVGRLDPLDEEILKPFIYHYRDDVRKMLARLVKASDSDSLDNLEDEALGDSSGDDLDGDLALDKKNSKGDVKAIQAAAKRFLDWCDNGYEKAPPVPGEAEEVAKYTTGGGEHPLLVRHRLLKAAEKKDVAFIESHLGDFFRQSRALALKLLAKLEPEKAYPHILKAMEDTHTWARLYASIDLAKLAKPSDAAKIRGFLAKEKNRAVKLYLEDALAKAEGRPLPPPRPAAHKIPTDRQLVWFCGGRGALTDIDPWEAYYTCADPDKDPNDVVKRAYANGKIFFSRPTPAWEGAVIVADPAWADLFWTRLDEQLPDSCLACQDGFVYGEESMAMSSGAAWATAWQVFCEEAGIDPKRIGGDIKKLTPAERAQYDDWGTRVAIEGFNVLYDFTKDYIGKLKPGIQVCTYMCQQCGTQGYYAKDWKFDVSAGYIYGVGPAIPPQGRNRAAYAIIRGLKTIWPDRPVQWLSWGIPRHPELEKRKKELAAAEKAKGRTPKHFPCYKEIYEQEPFFYRWDESYSANITSWQAGAMPGYFTSFATKGKEGGESCTWMDAEGIYPGYPSPSLEAGIKYAYADTLVDYQDALKRRDGPSAADEGGDAEVDDLSLEEEGGKDDPAYKQQQADIKAFRNGYFNTLRYLYDTARAQVGMPYYDPKDFKNLVIKAGRGRGAEGTAALWMNGYDWADNAAQPVRNGTLSRYRFIAVADADGKGTRMDEETRQAYLKWLRETDGVLWVEGFLGENPRRSLEHPDGDLRTKWPWDASITNSPNALVVWKDPAYKARVVFEKPMKQRDPAVIEKCGQLVKAFFAKHKVEMDWPVAAGVISTRVGNFEVHSLAASSTYEGTVEGVELLTGLVNPKITKENDDSFAMVVKGDWTAPWVAVHDNVRVLAGNRFKTVEKVKGGLKVTVEKGPLGEPTAAPDKTVKAKKDGDATVFTR